MLKYSNYEITFAEVPDEISLCINLTNCPHTCKGCHSPWLREDAGTPLTYTELKRLIKRNTGISCVCFMGGDKEPWEVVRLAKLIREDYKNLKTAWYSGSTETPEHQNQFNFIKFGPYIEELGPLTSKTTNQRMVEYNLSTELGPSWYMRDITYKFWKNA
jgi:anaerobic ribonucleoside-triphosphate reductase activating protein